MGNHVHVLLIITLGYMVDAVPRVDVHQTHPYVTPDNQLRYEYSYAIEDLASGVVSDKCEERYGETVRGSYSLLEPTGHVRSVTYQVDPLSGFKAVVKTRLPALSLFSSQLFHKSLEIHPQVEPDIQLQTSIPIGPLNADPPVNYHANIAAILGFQKIKSYQARGKEGRRSKRHRQVFYGSATG